MTPLTSVPDRAAVAARCAPEEPPAKKIVLPLPPYASALARAQVTTAHVGELVGVAGPEHAVVGADADPATGGQPVQQRPATEHRAAHHERTPVQVDQHRRIAPIAPARDVHIESVAAPRQAIPRLRMRRTSGRQATNGSSAIRHHGTHDIRCPPIRCRLPLGLWRPGRQVGDELAEPSRDSPHRAG